jgi:hypothetical protein
MLIASAAIKPPTLHIFGSFILVDVLTCRCFNESSHMLAMPQTLAPVRLDAGRPEFTSRLTQQPCDCGYVVRGFLDGSLPNRLTS